MGYELIAQFADGTSRETLSFPPMTAEEAADMVEAWLAEGATAIRVEQVLAATQ
jgi:hypothetical protein